MRFFQREVVYFLSREFLVVLTTSRTQFFFFLRKLGRVLELVDLRSSQKQMEQPRNSGEMTPLHALVDVGYT